MRFWRFRHVLVALSSSVALSGCAQLGFGPSPLESRSELLTLPVLHRRFHEQPLLQSRDSETIRIIWRPTFEPPFLVRFDRRADGTATEHIKQLSGLGGYTPGHLTRHQTREVSSGRFESLLRQLTASGFWSAPAEDPNRMRSLDGPRITVEAYVGGRHHQITRYSPADHPREQALVSFLLDATDDYQERPIIRLPWLW